MLMHQKTNVAKQLPLLVLKEEALLLSLIDLSPAQRFLKMRQWIKWRGHFHFVQSMYTRAKRSDSLSLSFNSAKSGGCNEKPTNEFIFLEIKKNLFWSHQRFSFIYLSVNTHILNHFQFCGNWYQIGKLWAYRYYIRILVKM